MNRRELAKNGFLALCGALFGKKPDQETIAWTIQTYVHESGCYWKVHISDITDTGVKT